MGVGAMTVGVDVGTMVGVLVGVGLGDGLALHPVLKSTLNSASPRSSRDKTMRMMNDRFNLALLHVKMERSIPQIHRFVKSRRFALLC